MNIKYYNKNFVRGCLVKNSLRVFFAISLLGYMSCDTNIQKLAGGFLEGLIAGELFETGDLYLGAVKFNKSNNSLNELENPLHVKTNGTSRVKFSMDGDSIYLLKSSGVARIDYAVDDMSIVFDEKWSRKYSSGLYGSHNNVRARGDMLYINDFNYGFIMADQSPDN